MGPGDIWAGDLWLSDEKLVNCRSSREASLTRPCVWEMESTSAHMSASGRLDLCLFQIIFISWKLILAQLRDSLILKACT